MGVHGLWKLLESTGKPINPETLEGKILAVDISIWLNQAVKGVRDRDGNSVQNAHLLTLFHRLCKLLFFRIRPIFVYDGDAPLLKKQTLAIRRQRKEEMAHESKQTNEKLLRTFLKRQAIKAALGDRSQETVPSISSVQRDAEDDMYVLPALPPVEEEERSSSDEEENRDGDEMPEAYLRFQEEFCDNPNSVDINSEEFSLLSPEIKHEILKEMKEFTKRRRTLYHTPPERSGDFSQYQLAGLLQRNNLNQRLEGVEKEMSQRSCGTVEEQYSQGGEHSIEARRLISEDSSHYVLIKGPQKTVKAPESQPAATPWSSGPWSRRGRPKGRPEPLWRPVSDDILEGNDPSSSSSSSSTTPKPTLSVEKQSSDGAPPSPRTLQAIQAAMMDTSSDEDEGVSKKSVQGIRMTSSQDENGGVSPRTLEAIQRAMMEDDTASKKDQTPQRKYVIITSSEDEDGEESKISVLSEAQEEHGGGVSPQTLLAIQRSLGESGTNHMEQQDHSTSSEGEEMEKVVGMRSKAFRSAVLTEGEECRQDEKKSSLADARRTVFPSSDESDEEIKPKTHHHASLHGQEEILEESDLPEKVFLQKGSLETGTDQVPSDFHIEKQREERKGQITVKSEEEDSSSEEDFIEVSEGEEVSELNDSVTRVDELLTSQTTQLDVNKSEEGVETCNEEADSSDTSLHLSLNQTEMEKQETESSQEATAVPASSEWDNIDTEELEQLERDLQAEQSSLQEQQQQQQRSAATVTGQMCQESQELLRLFGVPFLVAPMEAEAQCAALDRTDQTHGTITDDSDIWLFGGRHVYKNFFSNNKYVEHYQYVDIQNQLGLDRTKMINLAYLLGSDYTEGIPGVGYVTGMEILNEFPGSGLEPLTEFSEWWSEAQKNKKLVTNPKDTKVKKKLRNLTIHAGFPNPAVAQAYLQPAVDQSEGSFSWGRLQLHLIKEFCFSRFGWNSKKTEETLQPVLKQLNTQQTQLRIDSFFRLEQQEKQAIRSQRLRRAVTCLKRKEREGESKEEENDEDEKQVSPVKRGKNEKAQEGDTDITPAGAFGGGFIGSDVYADILEDKIKDEQPVLEGKQPSKPSKVESVSSSSSSEDERENSYGAAMVTARSVFEGKTRGRGKRGGRGGRGKAKKSL
ncbi:DNA repair protein complementing XP-G cells homolog [Colossoma macropomum]|uniref:DNA repair protein complementing XP-G cells homolog n=1 Tax=Colossoma macropomum TaxID=42526 RepID=UPI001865263C|nr:DNA repair protein complementing XP-G cells homolog [Colossoma macropomum]